MTAKEDLRRRFQTLRAAWPADAQARWSAAIRDRLLPLAAMAAARTIFTYISVPGEPDTHQLIRDLLAARRIVAVPWIPAGATDMQAHPILNLDECAVTPAGRGIPQPTIPRLLVAEPDVAIVPGVAFTADGRRLGRGGGHYDRYLAAHPRTARIALAFEAQIAEYLPTEAHDQPVHWLVTPDRVLDCLNEPRP